MAGDTTTAIIELVDGLRPGNPYTAVQKLQWINEVDGYVWRELCKYETSFGYSRQNGVAEYSLPAGVKFQDVVKVFVDGEEIPRISPSFLNTTGYYIGSTTAKFKIYPVPAATETAPAQGLVAIYLTPFTKLTAGQNVFIEAPYDKAYVEYIVAKMELYSQNFNSYNNYVDTFDNTYGEFADWWASRNPIEGSEFRRNMQGQGLRQTLLQKTKI
jgi:hypothetical protein